MHKALYREYRPKKFDDVIGQSHITKTLKNQIENNNLGHAYIFSGTRGTGKTSTAKIFSRAINCENKINQEPCNECDTCKLILNEKTIDVVEIDAASNNSVDDIRELRENVKYSPTNMKYKVYIIDEVHMLSSGAFNALLKTLEEPPSYVIFILATTDPQKIPATIVSRCQRFNFKRVTVKDMTLKMENICKNENILFDVEALNLIARNSQGALRDALSILEQCISFSDGKIVYEDVVEILGTASLDKLFEISESIINQDSKRSIKILNDFILWGKDIKILLNDLIEHFRNIMICKISDDLDDIISYSNELVLRLKEQANLVSIDELIRIINILSNTQDEIKYSTNQRVLLEVCIMKIAQPRFEETKEALIKRIENLENIINNRNISLLKEDLLEEDTYEDKFYKLDTITNKDIEVLKNSWNKIIDKLIEYKNLNSNIRISQGFISVLSMIDIIKFNIFEEKLFIVVNKSYINSFTDINLQSSLIKDAIKEVLSKNFEVSIVSDEDFGIKNISHNNYDKGLDIINNLKENTILEIK